MTTTATAGKPATAAKKARSSDPAAGLKRIAKRVRGAAGDFNKAVDAAKKAGLSISATVETDGTVQLTIGTNLTL